MALFHLNVSSIGKSSGSSAVASAAYRSCSSLVQSVIDPQTGIQVAYLHDFANKHGLEFSEVFAPEGLDSWCSDREKLWNKVEQRETHIKGRYARDIKLALQSEFTLEQNIQILSEYVKDTFVKDGIIADVNVHMDDLNNPHAHIMLTTRSVTRDDNGECIFGNKYRLLDSKGWLVGIRNNWADINNKYFQTHDIDKTITHESYKTRGFEFIQATIHEGAAIHVESTANILDRTEYNRNIVKINLQYIKDNPDELIQALAKNKSAGSGGFSRADLFKEVDVFLNEIALRNGDNHILITEARDAVLNRCESIFDKINQFDISLNLDSQTQFQFGQNIGNMNDILHENVISLIEDFYENIENKVKVSNEVEFIKNNSIKLIENMSKGKAIFNKSDLAKALDNHMTQAIINNLDSDNVKQINNIKAEILEKYDELLVGLTQSKDIVKLVDSDLGGKEIYTTKGQLALEKEFFSNLESLSNDKQHSLNLNSLTPESKGVRAKIISSLENILTPDASAWLENLLTPSGNKSKSVTLSNEQSEAVLSLVNGGNIVALSGMPGTGKSTVMAKLVDEYNNHGYEVIGAAVSAVAALNLSNEANIKADTLSKWQYDWDQRYNIEKNGGEVRNLLPNLTSKNVMIIDEMSMVDLKTFTYMTNKVLEAGAKLIVIGDNNQFSAIGVGGASERITEKCENIILTELFRQREGLDKEITRKLSNYRVDEALVLLDKEGRIRIGNSPEITRNELVNHYIGQLHQDNDKQNETRIVIAYRNDEVKELNLEIRNRLLNSGLIHTEDHEDQGRAFNGKNGQMKIALGEQLVFTKNQRYLGVLNGQLGKVVRIIGESKFQVKLLGKDAKGKNYNKIITINNDKFNNFDYGYAITAHKSQGKTYDHSSLLLDKSVGYEAFNVMATRHRINSIFYIDRGVLNDIVTRKFDNHKVLSHQRAELSGHKNQALFELLTRRNPNSLAHDYLDYDHKPEIIQIKEYLEVRNKASDVYRQLLDWQEKESTQENKLELWHNEKLWSKFKGLKAVRQQSAQELIEGYTQYHKYIKASVINYATLLKHADMASIEFNYQNNTHTQNLNISEQQYQSDYHSHLTQEFNLKHQELAKLEQSYISSPNESNSKSLLSKLDELTNLHEDHKYNLANLSENISKLENEKWALESECKSNIYYREDMKHYLNKTYKDGAKEVLSKWKNLSKSLGIEKALLKVTSEPEVLGSLVGTGWGIKLAVSEKRSIAVFNIKSLGNRLAGYEHSIAQERQLNKKIATQETSELIPLKAQYKEASSVKLMSSRQEKHLYGLQEHRKDLRVWLKGQTQLKGQVHNKSKNSESNSSGDNYSARDSHSYEQLHDKLSGDIVGLTKRLLPNMSDKRIEIQQHKIICGSIHIEREGVKSGLWYRFSNGAEKGDLFDLIKISQNLGNKKEAIKWGKSYLGLDIYNNHNAYVKGNTIAKENQMLKERHSKLKLVTFKVLSPVPHNAACFNPETVFAHQLRNKKGNNKEIESVHTYKNIKNELCGYVVRIKDIEANTKVTLPAVFTENKHGVRSWRAKGLGDERCLYNEQKLHNSNKPVLIVEGEKTADVAQSLYPEFDVVSWSGGVNGFNKTNWNILHSKQVTIWPDNDKPGINAAHNIKSLLESNDITKAHIIDLSKIEFLPEKWDLADKVPEDVSQHQITGALYASQGIKNDIRINKTLQDWKNYFNSDFENKEFKSLGEYMVAKQTMKYQCHFEQILLKKQLQTKTILSNTDGIFLDMEATKLANTHIKSLSLSTESTVETINNQIQHDLAQIHQTTPKELIINATKVAMENSQHIINEHSYNKDLNFTKADLPILTLALASEIVEHHNKSSNIEHINHDSSYINNQGHAEHQGLHPQDHSGIEHNNTINMIKNAFNTKLDQEGHNFEQHQHQVIQKQMMQHQGIEI
jgi:ATP-dependent exoDNAse (exonuclease V) alpha subunit